MAQNNRSAPQPYSHVSQKVSDWYYSFRSVAGMEFQRRGPAAEKLLSPSVFYAQYMSISRQNAVIVGLCEAPSSTIYVNRSRFTA